MVVMPEDAEAAHAVIHATIMHLARVTNVQIDEEGVVDVYGQVVSPIAVLDALEIAGFSTQLLSVYTGLD